MNAPAPHLFPTASGVSAGQREALLGQKGCVVWFTGLSGSGKSTLACALEQRLVREGRLAYILDGDNLRHGLCRDLGFSEEAREENLRRASEVARLFADCGVICLTAFISPLRRARERARQIVGSERFLEIHVAADLGVCEGRDVKGLYARARAGEIPDFTGISAPYEAPERPDLAIDTGKNGVEHGVELLYTLLLSRGLIGVEPAP